VTRAPTVPPDNTIDTVTPEHFDDPVAAYDRMAAHYADLSRRREPYLRCVECEIISRIPTGSRSLLDVGAGDGARALRIASRRGVERVVLVEPSRAMAGKALAHTEVWNVRAEDLAERGPQSVGTAAPGSPSMIAERFDVITCLWNVLGHIPTEEKRLCALSAIAHLLAPEGRLFLDVNHRYNLRSYGVLPTTARWMHDLVSRSESNGDVLAEWDVGDASVSTCGHVFTHVEIKRLAEAAGLQLEGRLVIDYGDGRIRRFAFQGNLLYIFRRSSRIDSASATQTS
jgi:SAM-dependent methyltransferase